MNTYWCCFTRGTNHPKLRQSANRHRKLLQKRGTSISHERGSLHAPIAVVKALHSLRSRDQGSADLVTVVLGEVDRHLPEIDESDHVERKKEKIKTEEYR